MASLSEDSCLGYPRRFFWDIICPRETATDRLGQILASAVLLTQDLTTLNSTRASDNETSGECSWQPLLSASNFRSKADGEPQPQLWEICAVPIRVRLPQG